MVQLLDVLIGLLVAFVLFSALRWMWFQDERKRLIENKPANDEERFDRIGGDEDDQTHSGRVIRKLRSRLIEGRVEIHWQYNEEYIHRGFVLTGKSRRNDGPWEPLAFEPHQDSGSWIECFNYGESRSYLFTVKKRYYFFFGLFANDDIDIVYDQISFSVRKGKYLKEKKEVMRDRRELLGEVKEYAKLESELRGMARQYHKSRESVPTSDPRVSKLEQNFKRHSEMTDFIEKKVEEINAHATWSAERKAREIERLNQMAEEIALED
jgi:hypothetical protein